MNSLNKTEWKTDLELYDVSTQYDSELRLVYSVFHADENLLSTVKCGDIIALLRVKVSGTIVDLERSGSQED